MDGDAGTQPVFNPATGEETGVVHLSGKGIVDQAVAAANEALLAWSNMPPLKRARIMFKYKELLANLDQIAEAISKQHGKLKRMPAVK